MIRHQTPETMGSEELSRYLKRAWPLLPGHVLKAVMKNRDVRVNGIKAGKGDMVRGGDVLEIYADERHFAPKAEIIFDDGHLLAAVKPQGLPSLPDRDGVGADTMETRLQGVHPGARLLHRLDAATGGVMLAAMDDETEAAFLKAFKEHSLKKRYRALLCGEAPKGEKIYRAYLLKDARRSAVRVLDRPAPGAKEIITRLKPLENAKDKLFYGELEPVTGRTHQLRAHMAHLHLPLLGDDKYGNREVNRRENMAGRLCLWCQEMMVPKDSPIAPYAGMKFFSQAPEWLKK